MYWQVKQLRILLAFVNGCLPKRCIELKPEVINTTTIYIFVLSGTLLVPNKIRMGKTMKYEIHTSLAQSKHSKSNHNMERIKHQ